MADVMTVPDWEIRIRRQKTENRIERMRILCSYSRSWCVKDQKKFSGKWFNLPVPYNKASDWVQFSFLQGENPDQSILRGYERRHRRPFRLYWRRFLWRAECWSRWKRLPDSVLRGRILLWFYTLSCKFLQFIPINCAVSRTDSQQFHIDAEISWKIFCDLS